MQITYQFHIACPRILACIDICSFLEGFDTFLHSGKVCCCIRLHLPVENKQGQLLSFT